MYLNQFLSLYRKMQGFSQQEVADRLHVSPSALNLYEKGNRGISDQVLQRLSHILKFQFTYEDGKKEIELLIEPSVLKKWLEQKVLMEDKINVSFLIQSDEEYPENLMLTVDEEETSPNSRLSFLEIWGEHDPFSLASQALDWLFETDVFFQNISLNHFKTFQIKIRFFLEE